MYSSSGYFCLIFYIPINNIDFCCSADGIIGLGSCLVSFCVVVWFILICISCGWSFIIDIFASSNDKESSFKPNSSLSTYSMIYLWLENWALMFPNDIIIIAFCCYGGGIIGWLDRSLSPLCFPIWFILICISWGCSFIIDILASSKDKESFLRPDSSLSTYSMIYLWL